ncbi:CG31200, partial [Drosophila busckii]
AVVSAEVGCGSLEERLLFSTDTATEPAEYSWMGILFQLSGANAENTRCSVIIVDATHVLTPASCVRRFNGNAELAAVRLGTWNETHPLDEEYICNTRGFCVPGPVQHRVAEIKIHPQADKDTGDNDLAILRLSKPIKWSAYVSPICLQAASEPSSWISHNLHFGGFDHSSYLKGKGLAMAVSRQYCTQLSGSSTPPPENQFCGYPIKRTRFYEGAGVLALNIEQDVPRNFYLAALLVKVINNKQTTVYIFQDLRPLRRWILDNTN